MMNEAPITPLSKQNEALIKQVAELEELLLLKDEELQLLRQQASEASALRSQLDLRLNDIVDLQNTLGAQQRKTASAQNREEELLNELTDSVHLLNSQQEIKKLYAQAKAQLEGLEDEIEKLKKENLLFSDAATTIANLQKKVEDLTYERDILLEDLEALEKSTGKN
jgi:DNA repair exonuclease SbcCD ATPase subunit